MRLVSIIIPLFNSEGYISDCLQSCIKQTYSNIEVLVVNDGSTDGGDLIAKTLSKTDKHIRVLDKKNGGVSSARNLGLDKSRGEYVCFIDADDKIEEHFIEVMVNYLEKNEADFCFSKNTYEDNSKNTGSKAISADVAETLLLSQRVKVGCWNKMYRKNILENIRFRNDLFYGEGLFFITQVAHHSRKTVVCEDALYHYRKVNPDSATAKFEIEKMVNGEKSLLEIKKLIKDDGHKVNRMWAQHYCLFCINAMKGILRKDNCDSNYKKWHKKMRGQVFSALCSNGGAKLKICILIAAMSPKLLYRITK